MGKESSTLLGLLAGTAIGATLGVLFAPDKGSHTRQRIADEALAAKDKVAESAEHLRDKVAETVAAHNQPTLDEQLETVVTNVNHKTDDIISVLEKKLNDLKSKNKKYQKTK